MAKKKPTLPFAKRLVLDKYLLSLFGAENFEELSIYVNKMENEGLTEDRISKFHYAVVQALPLDGAEMNRDTLLAYDQNIVSHTLAIQGKRPEPLRWKYFQYLALLFTEIYLDRYMNDLEAFVKALNSFTNEFNAPLAAGDRVDLFTEDDLRKVAFWSATGSGKTLIMHMNIKQYLHHLTKSGRSGELNRIMLVTPNEGLSKQHLEEFDVSRIMSQSFSKGGKDFFGQKPVEVIEITKLTEADGDKTVALDSFEGNNLVLVDEGHRGSSGLVWSKNRKKLAAKGFTFEYSATLGQAASGNASLTQEYAKSILFDYSYRYFYSDGYGKDYRILNIADDSDEAVRELYLTSCLLTFYQQKVLFKDPRSKVKQFNIENPLWVFVGGSVTKSTSSKDISDTIDILLFLARFTSSANKQAVLQRIEKAISGDTGLLSAKGQDIFANMFPYLGDHMQTAAQVYDGILKDIFNAASNASLHVEELKGTDGEIALRLGDNDPFGVINVGDAAKLRKLCEKQEILTVTEKNFTDSLFHAINKEHSTINILIGSKKFTEGWSSWRVSTMGLMNVGRSEGSQIIQLFGRGVRLKGHENTLKRHSALREQGITYNQYLTQLETLNIFGIRADYMEQFKAYLEEEGVPTEDNIEEIIIPVIPNLGKQKLKTVRLKDGLDYKRNGEKPDLQLRDEIKRNKVTLDYYPRIQAQIAKGIRVEQAQAEKNVGWLTPDHIEFLDMDTIFFDLQTFKNERAWFNLNISKAQLKSILLDNSWYEILIPNEQLQFDGFEKVNVWQNIASNLIQKYCDRYYKACKDEWEAPHREYRDLDPTDPSFISEYKVLIDKSQQQIIKQLQAIKEKIESGQMPTADLTFGQGRALIFDRHLYQPLLYAEGGDIQIKPVALNKGEKTFVEDLRNFYQQNQTFFDSKELYLLRNMSKGRGVGFFEAGNFYPDFVLWLLDGTKQYVSFVDPKGIFNLDPNDPKIEFYKTIKNVEKQLGDKNVILNSFIVSVTPYHKVRNIHGAQSQEDFASKHILFQEDTGYIKRLVNSLEAAPN
ncbi:DEAD/DEAH box helicase family protein [Alphaproteobacteria bacterium]|nr:DEAD/DEAH box helicase family protein [Alphaproteobacteria bacterium]